MNLEALEAALCDVVDALTGIVEAIRAVLDCFAETFRACFGDFEPEMSEKVTVRGRIRRLFAKIFCLKLGKKRYLEAYERQKYW